MKDVALASYIDDDGLCTVEYNWLYRSWLYSGSHTRSDLIIFYNPDIDVTKLPSGAGIKQIPLEPIWKTEPLWDDYHRINSTWFLTTDEAKIVDNYKYTFRVDGDSFLTKNFVNFRPRLATFGLNEWASHDNNVALKINSILQKFGHNQFFMNSTNEIFAFSPTVRDYAAAQYDVAKYLKINEFKDGHGEWPHWYEYIINLYSSCITANIYFKSGFALGGLGGHSMSHDPIGSTDFHFHAFHSQQDFSKVKWREGYYDDTDFDALDDTIVNQYCLKMAGKREDCI